MSGVIFDSGIIDTLIFTVIPQHAPLRYKVDTLFVDSQLSNAVGNVFPRKFELYPAYPNPFNPTATIRFFIESMHASTLNVYDTNGRLITTLIDEVLIPGQHTIQWDASPLTSGVYFIRLESGSFSQSQKLILLK